MSSEIRLEGWAAFKRKTDTLPALVVSKADAFVYDAALEWSQLAKRYAPKNFGVLANRIQAVRKGTMSAEVVSPTNYAPYMEWGTGTKVSVPAELTSYAIQFKGTKKVLGIMGHPHFFIHKPTIQRTLFARIDKLTKTPQ